MIEGLMNWTNCGKKQSLSNINYLFGQTVSIVKQTTVHKFILWKAEAYMLD
jgi:hypothetical protein